MQGPGSGQVQNMGRLNVKFSGKQNKVLQELAEELGTTKAGVLRSALSLLEVALRERKSGRQLGVFEGDRVVKEIIGWSRN